MLSPLCVGVGCDCCCWPSSLLGASLTGGGDGSALGHAEPAPGPPPPPPDEPFEAGVPGWGRAHDEDDDAAGVDVGLFSDGRPTLTATLLIVFVRLASHDEEELDDEHGVETTIDDEDAGAPLLPLPTPPPPPPTLLPLPLLFAPPPFLSLLSLFSLLMVNQATWAPVGCRLVAVVQPRRVDDGPDSIKFPLLQIQKKKQTKNVTLLFRHTFSARCTVS